MTDQISESHIGLTFMNNEADEDEGLSDSGVETFRDAPYEATSRENGQNSNDAAESRPVRIRFDVIEIATESLPGISELRQAVLTCLTESRAVSNENEGLETVEFFEKATELLERDELRILAISDHNTTGLTGPCVKGSRFHALLKGKGVSVGKLVDSGGSFGIGKFAPFSLSGVQTVLYSTRYAEETTGEEKFLAQGKSILISHTDGDGRSCRATGFWGHEFEPVEDPKLVPDWMTRTDKGTSVFVIGFLDDPDWRERMAYAVLTNFFDAISKGQIEFSIDSGSVEISQHTQKGLFSNSRIREVARKYDRSSEMDEAESFLDCISSADADVAEEDVPGFGRIGVRVLVNEGQPKRVAILRNGMLITSSMPKLQQFPMFRDFSAVVYPIDSEGSVLLRSIENPAHNKLSPERLRDPEKQELARKALKSLAGRVREIVRRHAQPTHDPEIDADEMAQYFSNVGDADPAAKKGEDDDPEIIIHDPLRQPKKNTPEAVLPKGNRGGKKGRKRGKRKGKKRGSGSGPSGNMRICEISQFRTVFQNEVDHARRTILFTPLEGGQATITLNAVGVNNDEQIFVTAADGAAVSDGRVSLLLEGEKRTSIDVTFDTPYDGPIEIEVAVAPSKGGAS